MLFRGVTCCYVLLRLGTYRYAFSRVVTRCYLWLALDIFISNALKLLEHFKASWDLLWSSEDLF